MIAEDVKWKNHINKPYSKQGQQNARTYKKNFRKQRPFTMERLVHCTDKTTSGVCSPNLESTSDWRHRKLELYSFLLFLNFKMDCLKPLFVAQGSNCLNT